MHGSFNDPLSLDINKVIRLSKPHTGLSLEEPAHELYFEYYLKNTAKHAECPDAYIAGVYIYFNSLCLELAVMYHAVKRIMGLVSVKEVDFESVELAIDAVERYKFDYFNTLLMDNKFLDLEVCDPLPSSTIEFISNELKRPPFADYPG